MTRNQIDYLNLVEKQRSNQETERLTRERDAWSKALGFQTLGETTRHNVATEAIQSRQSSESARHNLATEQLQSTQIQETKRHNIQSEDLSLSQLSELQRHNVASEDIQRREADTHYQQLGINRFNAETQRQSASEIARHNLAQETETYRNNVALLNESIRASQARESETRRHNLSTEAISKQQVGLGYAQLNQTAWYQGQQVQLQTQAQLEQHRANVARETETTRANITNEQERLRANLAKEELDRLGILNQAAQIEEQSRHNYALEQETSRHNLESESIAQRQARNQGISTWSSVINESARTVIGRNGILGILSQ